MRSIESIKQEIDGTLTKLAEANKQLADRSAEIDELKLDNAKLLEQHLGKQRQPPSLQTQRAKIVQEGLKIEELESVKISLDGRLEKLDQELKLSRLDDRSLQIQAGIESYTNLVQTANLQILELSKTLTRLERSKHPLQTLSDLLHEINLSGKTAADYEIDLEKIRETFTTDLVTVFDAGTRIEKINVAGRTAFNMLDSAVAGRSTFAVAQKLQTLPEQFDPVQQMNTYREDPAEARGRAFRKSLLKKDIFQKDKMPKVDHRVNR